MILSTHIFKEHLHRFISTRDLSSTNKFPSQLYFWINCFFGSLSVLNRSGVKMDLCWWEDSRGWQWSYLGHNCQALDHQNPYSAASSSFYFFCVKFKLAKTHLLIQIEWRWKWSAYHNFLNHGLCISIWNKLPLFLHLFQLPLKTSWYGFLGNQRLS